MDVLIRDLPDDVHAEITRRAADADMSLRAYIVDLLSRHVATPSMTEWLARIHELGPAHRGGSSGAEAVAAARAEDDALVGR
jgi:plasmid stability protein